MNSAGELPEVVISFFALRSKRILVQSEDFDQSICRLMDANMLTDNRLCSHFSAILSMVAIC